MLLVTGSNSMEWRERGKRCCLKRKQAAWNGEEGEIDAVSDEGKQQGTHCK